MFGESALGASSVRIPGIAWDRPLDLSSKAVQEKLSPAANRAFFSLAAQWKLRDEDARNLLGGISNGSFYQLKRSIVENSRPGQTHPHFPAGRHFQGAEHSL